MVAATVSGAVGEIRAGSTPVFRTIFVFKEEEFSMKLNKYYSMFKNLGLSKSLLQDAYQYENTHETFYSRCQEAFKIRCSKLNAGDESIIYSSLAAGTDAKMVETMEYYERYWRNYGRS